MPAKFKKMQTNRRRIRRTCKRGKGGMFRAATNKVMGKGFERVDKLNQIREAILKGVTQSQTLENFKPAAMPRQFQFTASSPLSPFFANLMPQSPILILKPQKRATMIQR